MTGALITLLSSTMAKRLADILAVASPNRARADRIELEADDRLVVVEARPARRPGPRRRPSRASARHTRRPGAAALVRAGRISSPGGSRPRRASTAIDAQSTSWNVSLAVWPSSSLTRSGSVDAGQLDQDAVLALALDRRLLGAGLVDAAADDLDRLLDAWRAARASVAVGCKLQRAGAVGRRSSTAQIWCRSARALQQPGDAVVASARDRAA